MENMKNNNITNMFAIAGAIIVVGSVVGGEAQLPIWGDLKEIAIALTTDNVKIQSTLANYKREYVRFYGGEFHRVSHELKDYPLANGHFHENFISKVSKTQNGGRTLVWWSPKKFVIGMGVDELNQQQPTNVVPEFAPLEIRKYRCDRTPSGDVKHDTSFGYRLTWDYDVSPNKAWPSERDCKLVLSGWDKRFVDCQKEYESDGAIYSTTKPIIKRSWQGEIINCVPMETISGWVNLEANRSGSQLRFETTFNQVYPTKP
jgi:hypothetical protein